MQNIIENHRDVKLEEAFLVMVAQNGYISTTSELLKVHPNPTTPPIISIFYGVNCTCMNPKLCTDLDALFTKPVA